VIYTDYNDAVVYNCDELLPDGHCAPDKVYVDVMSRSNSPMGDMMKNKLIEISRKACFEWGDFMESSYEGKDRQRCLQALG
jgi:hypothetical protein